MSEDVLVWVRRIKAQQAQAAILSDITESKIFDKVQRLKKNKRQVGHRDNASSTSKMSMQILWGKDTERCALDEGR